MLTLLKKFTTADSSQYLLKNHELENLSHWRLNRTSSCQLPLEHKASPFIPTEYYPHLLSYKNCPIPSPNPFCLTYLSSISVYILSRRASRHNNVPIRLQSEIFKEPTAKNDKNIHVERRDYMRARPSVDIETVSHEIPYRPISTQIL